MANDLKEHMKRLLDEQSPLAPLATDFEEKTELNGSHVKAFIFDVYGTLLVSSSGDIKESTFSELNLQKALIDADYIIHDDLPEGAFSFMLEDFRFTILEHHKRAKNKDIPYPEINIKEVWEEVLNRAAEKLWITIKEESCLEKFIITFEVLSNKVFPMPGMREIIDELKKLGYPMGIISNAQFYTPLIMNYFLRNEKLEEAVPPFDPELTVFSYQLNKSKPDDHLFRKIIPVLQQKYSIQPSEVVYVGNDMLKDIYAANAAGFKTALFAGDRRSLKLRENRVSDLSPDFIITELHQLKNLIKV
ncbi:MAG: HAD family hydrolase [Bacteroidales bacterium]|nr:HAD family hydrolase [Bacteroidales bacterium]MCF8338816.1 HAD family hydrolase [Bacteroidales bacterium]